MSHRHGDYSIDTLQPDDVPGYAGMTFPAYRHLLELRPALRLPTEPEQRLVQAVAIGARSDDGPAALALAEVAVKPTDGPPELLSLFVAAPHRGRGVATALVEAMERQLAANGAPVVE